MATTIQSGRSSSPLLTADVASRAEIFGGRGLVFDGVTDYLDSGSQESTWKNVSALSITAWIYIDAHKTSNALIGKHHSDNESTGIMTTASSFKFYISNGGENRGNCTPPSVGAWHHIACVFNGAGTGNDGRMQIYFNGSLQSLSFTGTIPTTTSNDSTYGTKSVTIGDYQSNNKFNGNISDVKVYSSALSESDIRSQYLKPESVPSPSTLVAWYPMIESNPESPQSIVYDHSEKGLGTNLVTNGSDWTDSNGDGLADSWSTVYGSEVTTIVTGNGFTGNAQRLGTTGSAWKAIRTSSVVFTVNVIYRLSFKYRAKLDGGGIDVADGSSGGIGLTENTGDAIEYSINFKGRNGSTLRFRLSDSCGSDAYIEVDDVKLQEVLMGNHATTTFFGDELFDADASTVDSGTHSWVAYAGATMTNDSGAIKIVCNTSNGNGAYLKFSDALDLKDDLTVGKTYRFTCSAKVNTGSVTLNMSNATGFSSVAVTETSFTTKTIDFVAGHAIDTFVYAHNGQNETIWLDNFSLKEVGISSTGFTTAQNEPVIPQIPLVKYNEKMLFDGVSDQHVALGSQSMGGNEQTISAWIVINGFVDTTPTVITFGKTMLQMNSGTITYYSNVQTGTTLSVSKALTVKKLYHIAITKDSSGNGKLYLNGVLEETDTSLANINNDSATSYIGRYGSDYFDGTIDEVSLFNTALSATEAQELFNDGVALDATTHSKSGNLVGYWRNDGVTQWIDRSTNSNHGTVNPTDGSVKSITIREGINSGKDGLGFPLKNPTSNIVRFSRNGSAEYLNIPDSDGLDIKGDFTIELWFKQPDMGTGYQYLISRDDLTNRNWFVNSTDGKISLGIYSGGSLTHTLTSGTYDDDNWHHLCIVITSGTSVQIYIDTVLAKLNTTSIPTAFDNDPASLNIGNRSATTDDFIGSIDEVRLYNKALTAFEADGSAPEEGETAVSGEVVKNYKHGKGKHKND